MKNAVEIGSDLSSAPKNDGKYVHTFVIAFKQNDYRITTEFVDSLNVFQFVFGNDFLKYAVFEATHCSCSPDIVETG